LVKYEDYINSTVKMAAHTAVLLCWKIFGDLH